MLLLSALFLKSFRKFSALRSSKYAHSASPRVIMLNGQTAPMNQLCGGRDELEDVDNGPRAASGSSCVGTEPASAYTLSYQVSRWQGVPQPSQWVGSLISYSGAATQLEPPGAWQASVSGGDAEPHLGGSGPEGEGRPCT